MRDTVSALEGLRAVRYLTTLSIGNPFVARIPTPFFGGKTTRHA